MKTIEYRTVDKSTWPRGPWDDEPDKKQWQDEATGLPCLIVRSRLGSLCGYVGIAEGHPLYEMDSDETELVAHGGVNFSNSCGDTDDESRFVCHKPEPGESDKVWWFGFDCAHAGDMWGMNMPSNLRLTGDWYTYRDIAYVEVQCRELAQQLKLMEKKDD